MWYVILTVCYSVMTACENRPADTFDIQTGKTGPPNVLYIHGVNASVFRKIKKVLTSLPKYLIKETLGGVC